MGSSLFASNSAFKEVSLASTNTTGAKGARSTWLGFGGDEVGSGLSRLSSTFALEGASTLVSGVIDIVLNFPAQLL